jgi:hypothetical protein
MSKRAAASRLMFGTLRGLKYPVKVVASLSGTGTVAAYGVISISTATVGSLAFTGGAKVYMTVSSGTNIGTLIATGR